MRSRLLPVSLRQQAPSRGRRRRQAESCATLRRWRWQVCGSAGQRSLHHATPPALAAARPGREHDCCSSAVEAGRPHADAAAVGCRCLQRRRAAAVEAQREGGEVQCMQQSRRHNSVVTVRRWWAGIVGRKSGQESLTPSQCGQLARPGQRSLPNGSPNACSSDWACAVHSGVRNRRGCPDGALLLGQAALWQCRNLDVTSQAWEESGRAPSARGKEEKRTWYHSLNTEQHCERPGR
jgi:hypothetical protein